MEMIVGPAHDMTREPRGPYRLTLAEFEALPVTAGQHAMRERIYALEEALCTGPLEDVGLERITELDPPAQPHNRFSAGIYARELRMKAGLLVVSKRHAQEHICIISAGRATVTTESGTQEICAPCTFVSPAGAKRVVWVHEDMVWTTIHRTDETGTDELEAALIIPEPTRAPAQLMDRMEPKKLRAAG